MAEETALKMPSSSAITPEKSDFWKKSMFEASQIKKLMDYIVGGRRTSRHLLILWETMTSSSIGVQMSAEIAVEIAISSHSWKYWFPTLRVTRGKIWRDIKKLLVHSWTKISCSTQRCQFQLSRLNSLGARVASKNLCRWKSWKITTSGPGCHGNGWANQLLAQNRSTEPCALYDQGTKRSLAPSSFL